MNKNTSPLHLCPMYCIQWMTLTTEGQFKSLLESYLLARGE